MWVVNINDLLFNEINYKVDEIEWYVYVFVIMENVSLWVVVLL